MKIENTTSFPNTFIRRMAGWVCRELGLKSTGLRIKTGRRTRSHWTGMCYGRRLYVNVHPRISTTEQMILLVEGLGHELFHTLQYVNNNWRTRSRTNEAEAVAAGEDIRNRFLTQREKLLQEWAR